MARKVFISFLGTGNYVNCKYRFSNEYISEPVRFIQEALIKVICNEWTENDKILIFCTTEAIRKNWNDNGHVDPDKPNLILEEIEKIGLESRLRNTKFWDIVSMHQIEDGFSEKEIWSIFDEVYKQLNENDEIYFDVTHAFRSIPMFSTVLFSFSQFMKNTTLKSVHYGAFEKLGLAYKVKKEIALENRIAPVINLTGLINLQNLTQVSNGFVEYGKIGKVGNILSTSSFPQKLSQTVDRLKQTIEKLEGYILTNRLKDIKEAKFIKEINVPINKLLKSGELKTAEIEILNKLTSRLSAFTENSDNNILAAINWAFEYDMITQAYTMAQEYIISLISELYQERNFYGDEKPKDRERNFRMFIGGVLGISQKDIETNVFENKLSHNIELARLLLEETVIKNVRVGYKTIADNRNILNHAKNSNLTVEQFKRQFQDNFYKCVNIASLVQTDMKVTPLPSAFINLTNHPSSLWCDKQQEAARTYGEIMDMPFPMIDETDDETYISALADEYLQKILELAKDNNVTVHLMGELTFTFALLKRLQEYGIPCVASTSKRIVKEEEVGRKGEVIFQFERFRRYE